MGVPTAILRYACNRFCCTAQAFGMECMLVFMAGMFSCMCSSHELLQGCILLQFCFVVHHLFGVDLQTCFAHLQNRILHRHPHFYLKQA